MLYVIHGDNNVASRHHLNQLIDQAKQKGVKDIVRLEGKKITLTELIQALETQSLFGTDRLVVIENLLSRPRSKIKDQITTYLKQLSNSGYSSTQTLIWEAKPATTPQLKSLGNPTQQLFKISKTLFTFLESINTKPVQQTLSLLDQTLAQEAVELIFVMLSRQVRLLIQVQHQVAKLPAWQLNKLHTQSRNFTSKQLLKLHFRLLQLDQQIKTGQNTLDLKHSIKLILTQI